mmetsp:Transcript_7120/g.14824  ORF Transcript_7120/g.14824 Transcript_7120/m.14824 type:complete len:88 (+) Transcript_7120:46-309(+)
MTSISVKQGRHSLSWRSDVDSEEVASSWGLAEGGGGGPASSGKSKNDSLLGGVLSGGEWRSFKPSADGKAASVAGAEFTSSVVAITG